MDALAAATLFAQVVGLLADYAASRGSKDVLEIGDLVHWATTHGHADLAQAIERNQATTISVKAALSEGRDELLAKLRALDAKLSALAAGSGALDAVAQSLRPGSVLSDQAREILRTLEEVKAEGALERNTIEGPSLVFWGRGVSGTFVPSEPRFYSDDMSALCGMGLLSLGWTKSGGRSFKPTRLGSQLGRKLLAENGGEGAEAINQRPESAIG